MVNNKIHIQLKGITELKFHFVSVILLCAVLLTIITPQTAYSQNINDNIKAEKTHSPHKASLYSAILPGMGQIYNRQYWKVPVLYAGIATITYFFIFNTNKYHNYRDEYVARINSDSLSFDPAYSLYSDNTILQLKSYYQRNLEFTYIIAGVVYLLNIIDASVYAHLFRFDVSDDLSLRVDPLINNNSLRFGTPPTAGLRLSLRF